MKLSKLFLSVFAFIVLVVGFTLTGAIDTSAKPKGLRDTCLGKKIDSFNVILKPNNWDAGGNACNGSRIFFDYDGGGPIGKITWELDPTATGSTIEDCDGTDGYATVIVDEDEQDFVVAIRVVGHQNSRLDLACEEVVNPDLAGANNEDLCIYDFVSIHKSSSFTKVTKNIAESEYEEVLYTLDGDWKIFQVWLMEWDGTNCF